MGARLLVVALAGWTMACAVKTPPSIAAVSPSVRLADAAALVRAGCLDCLIEARHVYDSLRGVAAVAPAANAGAITSGLLIAAREADLGLSSSTAVADARGIAADAHLDVEFAPFFDFADAFFVPVTSGLDTAPTAGESLSRMQFVRGPGLRAAETLRARAADDIVSAALWLGLACSVDARVTVPGREQRDDVIAPWADVPLIAFKRESSCGSPDRSALTTLLEGDPRFAEINYSLGLSEFSGRQRGEPRAKPDVDRAEAYFLKAYAWRQDWPALTIALGSVAEAVEDFERAHDFYALTLELMPGHLSAEAGTLRMLAYLRRSEDAIAYADVMLAAGHLPGDARYWRAYSAMQLERFDEAWDDIEKAAQLLINSDVPKLAGLIAINRRDYDNARARLELAIQRRATGCDAVYYLQAVHAQQRVWEPAAQIAERATACLDREMVGLQQEIAEISAGDAPEARKASQVARRQRQFDADGRNRVLAIFNAAVANFNLRRNDVARRWAEQVENDPQIGERAKEILERTR